MPDLSQITEDIISRLTPEDIYGDGFVKKGSGNALFKRCPLHEEKTPSFKVDTVKLTFHCFGCGEGGSAFDFIMKRDRIDFGPAMRFLADKAGVQISNSCHGNGHARLFELNKEAMSFYKAGLRDNGRMLEYLASRGITQDSIERFNLGCTNGTSLVTHLKAKGYTDEEMIEAGVANRKDRQLRDHFWKRLLFPIVIGGKVRGFGGRVLGNEEPKYLNTPATPIFQKKELLYGLDKSAIRDKGCAIIVEGYADVIMCHQYGFRNTVAPLGTSLGIEHIRLLRQCCNMLFTVFDGDKAGRNATSVSAKLMFDERMQGGVVMLPEGEDPDTFLRKGGNLSGYIASSMPYSVFLHQKEPMNRKMIFNQLLLRNPLETVEFLAHIGTPEEVTAFEEISFRHLFENFARDAPVVFRKGYVEIKKVSQYLVLYSKKRAVFWERASKECGSQAEKMAERLAKVKAKKKRVMKSV